MTIEAPLSATTTPIAIGAFPLLWSPDVTQITDWAVVTLGLVEDWRAANDAGVVEHAELTWLGGKVSVNIKAENYASMGPSGIGLRVNCRAEVDRIHQLAVAADVQLLQPLMENPVAYSFTAVDPDGNQWWVHAETGMLDQLRQG